MCRRSEKKQSSLCKETKEVGYKRTWQQCRVKVNNTILKYQKIKDSIRRSRKSRKGFEFFQQVGVVLGTRPALKLTILVSSCTGRKCSCHKSRVYTYSCLPC